MSLPITRFLMLAVILMAWLPQPSAQQGGLLAAGITLVSPSACPSTGCAAGQRLNYKVEFNLTRVDPTRTPNLQLCFYTPNEWHASLFGATLQGTTTTLAYSLSTANCGSLPTGYDLLGGVTSTLPSSATSDILPFSFRIGSTAVNPHIILVRVLERDTNNIWQSQADLTTGTPMNIVATSSTVFVANDAAACGNNAPCYINSQDDQSTGIGTGLKDAIDAATNPATISVVGNYTIKQNAVVIDKPHTIKSSASGRITYTDASPICTQAMLSITSGAKLSGLVIDDGSCTTSPARNLVTVSSPDPVVIETSDLTGGVDAIRVLASNVGNLTARFNQIQGNVGYAIYLDSANTGVLNAFANNLYSNRTGAQVECNGAAKGTVDHNFWGTGVLATVGSSQCTVNDNKRLGARALRNTGAPGVQAQQVTVSSSAPQYIFNNSIGYQRGTSGNDFGLVIVNHGHGNAENVPFSTGQLGTQTSCNNFYDIFLADTTAPVSPANLKLLFKYNLNANCISTVERGQYCNQIADSTAYPLWWYDLAANNWKTTGTGGQATICRMDANKEIQVTIDNSANHPNFNDLGKLPFTVAIPGDVIITSLVAQPGSGQVSVQWVTTSEVNISGFYVQRSENETSGFVDVNPNLIARLGSGNGGASYQYTDSGLTNYLVYYYRLRILKSDNTAEFSNVVSVTPFPATPTITLTPTPSRFPTSTFIFKSNTPTQTFTLTPTSPFKSITNTPLITVTNVTKSTSGSLTPRPSGSPVATTIDASTALAQTRALRTELAWLSETPTSTPTPVPVPGQASGPLTIVLAILAVGTLAGGAIFLIREQAAH